MDIKDYVGQLMQLCECCKYKPKCLKKGCLTKLCLFKKFAFNLAKKRLKEQERINL